MRNHEFRCRPIGPMPLPRQLRWIYEVAEMGR